jgi:N-acetylneuraminic acid mutarotase
MRTPIASKTLHRAQSATKVKLPSNVLAHSPSVPGPIPDVDISWDVAPAGNLVTPRGFMAAALLGTRIYCCGGDMPGEDAFNSVEVFDVTTHISTPQPSLVMPVKWEGMACVVSADFPAFVLFGGSHSNSCYICDAADMKWLKAADLPVRAACLAGVAGPDGHKYYAIGGNGYPASSATQATVQVMTNATWTTAVAPLNQPRLNHAAATANGRIYVFGGLDKDGYPLATVEEYDPALDSWSQLANPMPTPRYNLAAATGSNGRIYTIGGMYACSAMDVVEEFDPIAKTWRSLSPMPTARYGHAAVATPDGRIFVLGGWRKVSDKFYVTGVVETATLPTI